MASAAKPYHHGDLAAALVAAGLELARDGGPDAIGLREVTRAVGVTPNAAYRHFADRDALVLAVATAALEHAADPMRRRLAAVGARDPQRRAVARLQAVGHGYVDFALAEPGLFQLAFQNHHRMLLAPQSDPAPFALLVAALDGLAAVGLLPPARRVNAEWACWSAVHGIADLATRGPLRNHPAAEIEQLVAVVIDRSIDGVAGAPVTGRGARRLSARGGSG